MELTPDNLQQLGAFTGALVRREITWTNQAGDTHTATAYVRPLSYHTALTDVQAAVGGVDGTAGRIAASICDRHGRPVFSVEHITGMDRDGNPLYVRDAEGQPVPETDAEGQPVLDDDGQPVYQQRMLDGGLSIALLEAIAEVNGLGKTRRRSAKKKNSGTSS